MAYRDVESRSSTSGEDPPIPSSRPSPLSSSSSLSPSLPNKDIFSDDSSEKGNENSDKKAEMKEEGEKGEEIVEVDKFVEEGGVEEGEEEGNRSSNACINCFSPIPHFFKTKFRSKEFWKRNWWVILGYIFGGFLLFFFSLLLLVALMFETGLTSRFGLLLWIVVSFALMQIIATGVYFLFPSNRNCNRPNLRRRGICIGVELFLYFWVAEIFLLFLLPSSFLFSTSSYNEVGDINVNVFSPKGQEWFNSVNCNISDALEKARRFLGCSVDVNAVSFYIGGSPYIFRQSGTAAMTIYNNIFFEDLNAYLLPPSTSITPPSTSYHFSPLFPHIPISLNLLFLRPPPPSHLLPHQPIPLSCLFTPLLHQILSDSVADRP